MFGLEKQLNEIRRANAKTAEHIYDLRQYILSHNELYKLRHDLSKDKGGKMTKPSVETRERWSKDHKVRELLDLDNWEDELKEPSVETPREMDWKLKIENQVKSNYIYSKNNIDISVGIKELTQLFELYKVNIISQAISTQQAQMRDKIKALPCSLEQGYFKEDVLALFNRGGE
jgi:hypothetical protein